jgi:hypothetical protein
MRSGSALYFGRNARLVKGGTLAKMPRLPADQSSADDRSGWLVACLCAAWCRTCDDYREVMSKAVRAHPGVRFAWVDIEDHADALDDPTGAAQDIENFPTLLIAHDGAPHFFGTVTPQPRVLARLVHQALAGELRALGGADAHRLATAVTALAAQDPKATRV